MFYLDIYLFSHTVAGGAQEMGYFKEFHAFYSWINMNVEIIRKGNDIALSKETLQKLKSTLDNLGGDDCLEKDGFFYGTEQASHPFYSDVMALKKILENVLSTFDFEQGWIEFSAWW